jgi:hypothetical protein
VRIFFVRRLREKKFYEFLKLGITISKVSRSQNAFKGETFALTKITSCGQCYKAPPRRLAGADVKGCQMVCSQTKNPNFGKIWRALKWKMLVYFMTIWNILRPFSMIYGLLV